MGEMRFNGLGFNPNRFQPPNPATFGATGKLSSKEPSDLKASPGLNVGKEKDTLNISHRSAEEKPGAVALENPSQVIRLAVAHDPRGSSLHPTTLGRLKNPPEGASGFNI